MKSQNTDGVPDSAVALPRLVRLANGDWVKPSAVKAIRKLEIQYCNITKELYEPRYVVEIDGGSMVIIQCADAAEVTKQVEELVAAINGTGLPNAEPIRSASSLPNYQKTMIPQHTPGPWNADLASPYPSIYESAEPFRLICDFQDSEAPNKNAAADATLIAAAPETLQALQILLGCIIMGGDPYQPNQAGVSPISQAKAAVTKACVIPEQNTETQATPPQPQ